MTSFLLLLLLLLLLMSTGGRAKDTISSVHQHELSADFYAKTCPQVDNIVGSVTSQRHKTLPVSGPATIRLFFHDCFVQGCDGSILLEAGAEGKGERQMFENRNLGTEGFDTVNSAKAAVEKICPGLVSCADILAIAARDFVHLAGGPYYAVKKGRKDSKYSYSAASQSSLANIVRANLPRANSTVTELIGLFGAKGLSSSDLVALSIGFSHCDQFDERTEPIVREMATDKGKFFAAFQAGMERLGAIRVKKGKKGEIRRDCGSHLP